MEQANLDKFLEENMTLGWTCLSKSLMADLFFFIKKKDVSLQRAECSRSKTTAFSIQSR